MGLTRLESLISRNSAAPKDIKRLISEAVHLIVHISRTPQGRTIKEVIGIKGFSENAYDFQFFK